MSADAGGCATASAPPNSSDAVVDELIVRRLPQALFEQIQRYVDNSITLPVLALRTSGSTPFEATRLLAPGS